MGSEMCIRDRMGLHALTAWLLTVPVLVGATYAATRPVLRALAARLPARRG